MGNQVCYNEKDQNKLNDKLDLVLSKIASHDLYLRPFDIIENKLLNLKNITKIVLTGGPCGGKTTALIRIKEIFSNLGQNIFCAPEAASLMFGGGCKLTYKDKNKPFDCNSDESYKFEKAMIQLKIKIEETFLLQAKNSGSKAIILYDRGIMDNLAYVKEQDIFDKVLEEFGTSRDIIRDQRYDLILHLVSTADGAKDEQIKNKANNPCRSESLEQAQELEQKTQKCQVGHSELHIIKNEQKTFDEKIEKAIDIVKNQLRIATSTSGAVLKFLLKLEPTFPNNFEYQSCYITDTYLRTENKLQEDKLSKKGNGEIFTQTYQTCEILESNKRRINKQSMIINKYDYMRHLHSKDSNRQEIKRLRRTFLYGGNQFYLDTFNKNTNIIHIMTSTKNYDTNSFPKFLELDKDITYNTEYEAYNMSYNKIFKEN